MHRDLKSGNIMVDLESKTPKIIDWGSAEFYSRGAVNSASVGTSFWRGPE